MLSEEIAASFSVAIVDFIRVAEDNNNEGFKFSSVILPVVISIYACILTIDMAAIATFRPKFYFPVEFLTSFPAALYACHSVVQRVMEGKMKEEKMIEEK